MKKAGPDWQIEVIEDSLHNGYFTPSVSGHALSEPQMERLAGDISLRPRSSAQACFLSQTILGLSTHR